MKPDKEFQLRYDPRRGLTLSWDAGCGVQLKNVPIRVRLRGSAVFKIWDFGYFDVHSGEGAPAWAEKDLDLAFFAPAAKSAKPGTKSAPRAAKANPPAVRIDRLEGKGVTGYRVTAAHDRATVQLDLELVGGELAIGLSVTNPQSLGGPSLPLCALDLSIGGLDGGPDVIYECAHGYGGRTHGWGRARQLGNQGVSFVHGCIGLAFPLVCLHNETTGAGLQFEFMMDHRPTAWLHRDGDDRRVGWRLEWATDRLLEGGQAHVCGGKLRLRAYRGRPVEQIRLWRDHADARYGLRAVPAPDWARRANIIEFNSYPGNKLKSFTRLDDPKCLELLKTWKAMGYTAIFTVGHNNTGSGALSPFNYDPCEAAGGADGEKQYLRWVNELGMKAFLWVTTVGMDRQSPEVAAHPEWWTHRPDGSLFYCWDSKASNNYVGYAPDADPLSTGWRAWLKNEVAKVVGRGYDGVFVDGCIPRASNHARWDWPGQARNAVPDQVRELADFIRKLKPGLILFVEDDALYAQASCEMVQGRYHPHTPFSKVGYWDQGMGGGPQSADKPPERIAPEQAREYLLLRYASRLPGCVESDITEGYYSEIARPWTVQSLLAGTVPKTHSQYVDFPDQWRPESNEMDPFPESQKDPAHRLCGHEEFLALLKLCRDEPIIREAPLSIEAVAVTGDDAVVGILRPTKNRAILCVMQFADRPAQVAIRLAEPIDVPQTERPQAGTPHKGPWQCREIQRSMVDASPTAPFTLSPNKPANIDIGPYGFRIFELKKQ